MMHGENYSVVRALGILHSICQSRYYDPEVGRFLNADDTDYLNISGTVLGCNLYSYCENNVVNNEDPSGNFSIYSWTISIAIDAIIFWLAGWLNATWLGYMAPIKMMGKRSAAAFFAKNIAWRLKSITNSIINVAVKALIWIGKKAYAGLFNVSAKWAISALIREPLLIVTACTSLGGLIASIWDYFSDKRFDGKIKLW